MGRLRVAVGQKEQLQVAGEEEEQRQDLAGLEQ
jgi:hypothetical protein